MRVPVAIVVRDGLRFARAVLGEPRRPRRRTIPWHHPWVDSGAFATAVIERLPPAARAIVEGAGGFAAQLALGLAAVHGRWPAAPVPAEAFADYVAARIARQVDLASALPRLRVEDVFLAWWAGGGEQGGIAAFEAAFADDIARLVARFHRLPAVELRQRLRVKLFVGERRKILDYAGFGFLQNWLRVTAARDFVDAARSERGAKYETELDEDELLGGTAGDPRSGQMKAQLGGTVKRAFAEAVASLAPRQRTFLRHAYVDRLTLDQIAATYQMHRATVARTLASAREHLIDHVRAAVAKEVGVSPDDLASTVAALDTHLGLSLSRVLKAADDDGDE